MPLSPSQSRKHRGYATQRLTAEYLRDVFPYAEPTGAGRQGRDILSTPGVAFECKARRGFSPLEALKQAEDYAGPDIPVAVLRMDGQGEKSIDDWPCVIRFSQLKRLLKEAGYAPESDAG